MRRRGGADGVPVAAGEVRERLRINAAGWLSRPIKSPFLFGIGSGGKSVSPRRSRRLKSIRRRERSERERGPEHGEEVFEDAADFADEEEAGADEEAHGHRSSSRTHWPCPSGGARLKARIRRSAMKPSHAREGRVLDALAAALHLEQVANGLIQSW